MITEERSWYENGNMVVDPTSPIWDLLPYRRFWVPWYGRRIATPWYPRRANRAS